MSYLHNNCRVSSVQECRGETLTHTGKVWEEEKKKQDQWKVTSEQVDGANMQEPQTSDVCAYLGPEVQVMHREEQKT